MKKIHIIGLVIITFFLMGFIFSSGSVSASEDTNSSIKSVSLNSSCPQKHENFAEWRGKNQKYLFVVAENYYELGFLTGHFLLSQIITFDNIIDYFIQALNLDLNTILFYAKMYNIPESYKSEMQGIADATGLTYEDILLQVVFLDLYYGILIPLQVSSNNIGACTAFAVKIRNSHIVHGQTMDFALIFQPTLVWVHHKIHGKKEVFTLRMGASTLAIGKNRRVSCTLNLVQTWKKGNFGVPSSIKSRIAFENCKNTEDFLSIMISSYCASWNYIICDKKGRVLAIETVPGVALINQVSKEEFAVKTNTYTSDQLKPFLIDPLYSIARQKQAEQLINAKLVQKRNFKIEDGISIECYYDGSDASICRYPDPNDPLSVATLASFTTSFWKKGYFGIGTPDGLLEKIPI
ncbi:MAG: C45 family autoproteolytic acyltransferase/hydrolase [Candidatus Hermodarchaeota archaeon]